MPQRTSVHTGRLAIPLPENCSDEFAAGWSLADMHLAVPPLPSFVPPQDWTDEKQVGYQARMAATCFLSREEMKN